MSRQTKTFPCPECGARQRAAEPGAVVSCRSCANPIVVPAPPRAAEAGPPPAPTPTVRRRRGPQTLWGTAMLVLVIVAVAHGGLYLLLTKEARSGLRSLEARYGRAALAKARRPAHEAPPPGTPAYAVWRQAVERHEDAGVWRTHRRHVGLLRTGFLASFLVQVAITGWILMRLLGKQAKASEPARPVRRASSDA